MCFVTSVRGFEVCSDENGKQEANKLVVPRVFIDGLHKHTLHIHVKERVKQEKKAL